MNDNRGIRRQIFVIASLTVFISTLTGVSVEKEKKRGVPHVPLYESEEIAAPALESRDQYRQMPSVVISGDRARKPLQGHGRHA